MNQEAKFYYVTGLLTATVAFLVLFLFLGYRVGFERIVAHAFPARDYRAVVDIPDDLLAEMKAKKMVIDNARNPTETPAHASFLVQEDEELGYVLRSNVEVVATMLRSVRPFNFDLPVLYREAHTEVSETTSTLDRKT